MSKRIAMPDYLRPLVAVIQGRMETNDERRRRKLSALCERHGGVRALAELTGVAWATLDQILKGTLLPKKDDGTRSPRALGDANARAIEEALDLGRGWFDWPFDSVDFKAYAALSDTEKGFVQANMAAAMEGGGKSDTQPSDLTPEALKIAQWFDRITDERERVIAEVEAMAVILRVLQHLPPTGAPWPDSRGETPPEPSPPLAPASPPKHSSNPGDQAGQSTHKVR
jgi:hypothetical protein